MSLWEGLDKSEEDKVSAQSVQTTFCIALSLISTGDMPQRIKRALNWVRPETAGCLNHDEVFSFCTEFYYLGAETLAFLSKTSNHIVDLVDVRALE